MNRRLPIRGAIDWGELAPLRLRAREVAEGLYAGAHRSVRRGTGVEFGGFREYVPGDDLRWLDRRSLLRHNRLVVRQFETETDRAVHLLVDASASMAFRGPKAPGAKFAFASLIAAALARIALASADPVSLRFIGGRGRRAPVGRAGNREQFDRVVSALEAVEAGGTVEGESIEREMMRLSRTAKRGAIVIALSDLVDLPGPTAGRLAELASGGRVLVVVQTLDPVEAHFPFRGTIRLRALEGEAIVETDADVTRAHYLSALDELTKTWERAVVERGGHFVRSTTTDDAVQVVRRIVESIR